MESPGRLLALHCRWLIPFLTLWATGSGCLIMPQRPPAASWMLIFSGSPLPRRSQIQLSSHSIYNKILLHLPDVQLLYLAPAQECRTFLAINNVAAVSLAPAGGGCTGAV